MKIPYGLPQEAATLPEHIVMKMIMLVAGIPYTKGKFKISKLMLSSTRCKDVVNCKEMGTPRYDGFTYTLNLKGNVQGFSRGTPKRLKSKHLYAMLMLANSLHGEDVSLQSSIVPSFKNKGVVITARVYAHVKRIEMI